MAFLPASDTNFQVIPYAEAGNDGFRLKIPMSTVKPASAVPAGTTYSAATLPEKPKVNEGWADYVAGRREAAEDDAIYQHFVRALPSTPNIAESEKHPIFGTTYVHAYDDLISNTRPDRGDSIAVTTGALEGWDGSASTGYLNSWDGSAGVAAVQVNNVRVVLECIEKDLGQGLCAVEVTTVANAQAIIEEDRGIDEETGELDTETKTHTLTSTRPAGADTDSEGYYTLVTKPNHNWYVATRSKGITGPINLANALTWTKTERTPVYWPPVLVSHEFVAILDEGSEYWHKRFNYSLKAAYTGDVKVHYSQWWQATEPAEVTATEMLPTAVSIRREWSESISIEPCLHPSITVRESAVAGLYPFTGFPDTGFLRTIQYSVPATNVRNWPNHVTKLDVQPYKGGFKCLKRVIDKPVSTVSGVTIALTPWNDEGYIFTNYA